MLIYRVLTSLVFAPALLWLVWKGGIYLQVTCALIAVLMMWETFRMVLPGEPRRFSLVGYIVGLGIIVASFRWEIWLGWPVIGRLGWPGFGSLWLPGAILAVLLVNVAHPEPLEKSFGRAGRIGLGALYAAGLLPYLSLLRDLDPDRGVGLAMSALFCTWGGDTGAYFAGRALGRHKLYPAISPGKTVEGAVGGILAAVGVAFLVRWLFGVPLTAVHTVLIGALAGFFGIAGDLAESMLKRSAGAKDSSRLIPGHGGVLDRFDGVMFVAPALYVYAVIFLL